VRACNDGALQTLSDQLIVPHLGDGRSFSTTPPLNNFAKNTSNILQFSKGASDFARHHGKTISLLRNSVWNKNTSLNEV
jgi:hypothetical protein